MPIDFSSWLRAANERRKDFFGWNTRGRKQIAEDAATLQNSKSMILHTLLATGILSGVATGASHFLRNKAVTELDDEDLHTSVENAMGAVPQKPYARKLAYDLSSDVPPPGASTRDRELWPTAPADAGSNHYSGVFSPTFALPGVAAAVGLGYFGGKGIADWLAYRLRLAPAKQRMEEAKREFEETVAGLSKHSALERRLEAGYGLYKRGTLLTGGLLTGMGGLGLLAALATYNRYKAPDLDDVYHDQLKRYLTHNQRLPARVVTSAELAAAADAADDDEDRPRRAKAAADEAVTTRSWPHGGVAGPLRSDSNPFSFTTLDPDSQEYANKMLDQYDNSGQQIRTKMENAIKGAQPTGAESQALADAAGAVTRHPKFLTGAFDALSKRIGLPTVKTAFSWDWLLTDYGAGNVASGIGGGVVKAVNQTKDRMLRTPESAGQAMVSGNMNLFTSNAGQHGPEGAIAEGVMNGVKAGLPGAIKNPFTRLMVGWGMGGSGGHASDKELTGIIDANKQAAVKAADMRSAFVQAGENFGKAWATTPGGLGDRINNEVVPKFVNERIAPNLGPFGGFFSRAFSSANTGWGDVFGNTIFGGGAGTQQAHDLANNPGYAPQRPR